MKEIICGLKEIIKGGGMKLLKKPSNRVGVN